MTRGVLIMLTPFALAVVTALVVTWQHRAPAEDDADPTDRDGLP